MLIFTFDFSPIETPLSPQLFKSSFISSYFPAEKSAQSLFAFDIFKDKELKDSEYFIRLDSDSYFLDVRRSFIYNLQNIKADYGYIYTTIQSNRRISFKSNSLYTFA